MTDLKYSGTRGGKLCGLVPDAGAHRRSGQPSVKLEVSFDGIPTNLGSVFCSGLRAISVCWRIRLGHARQLVEAFGDPALRHNCGTVLWNELSRCAVQAHKLFMLIDAGPGPYRVD